MKYPDLSILVVHHARKTGSEDPFDEASGTLGLTGGFDNLFAMKDDGNKRYLYVTERDVEAQEKIALLMDDK